MIISKNQVFEFDLIQSVNVKLLIRADQNCPKYCKP